VLSRFIPIAAVHKEKTIVRGTGQPLEVPEVL